tara:strand:+ start:718 stop:1002 length:285 start_codon:yes stop_codon:yes gene_type:complete
VPLTGSTAPLLLLTFVAAAASAAAAVAAAAAAALGTPPLAVTSAAGPRTLFGALSKNSLALMMQPDGGERPEKISALEKQNSTWSHRRREDFDP